MSYLDRDTYVDWTPSGRRGNLMCARTTPGQISKICPVRRRATRASCYPAERTPENPRVSCIHILFKTKVRITAVKREAYTATYLGIRLAQGRTFLALRNPRFVVKHVSDNNWTFAALTSTPLIQLLGKPLKEFCRPLASSIN